MHYFYPNAWKLLEFPALGDDLCSLKKSTKLFKLISSISAQNHSDFSEFLENSLCWYGKFCHFTAPFDDYPDYSGFSF